MSSEEAHDFVTLVSNDGFEFKVLRSAACISGVMKRMLDPNSKIFQSSHLLDFDFSSVNLQKYTSMLFFKKRVLHSVNSGGR